MKTITILIGGALPDANVTLEYPELRKLPSEYMPAVVEHLAAAADNPVIRTCSDTIVNFVGEMIDYGFADHERCFIKLGEETFKFDFHGVIEGNWPYGAMCFWNKDEMETTDLLPKIKSQFWPDEIA